MATFTTSTTASVTEETAAHPQIAQRSSSDGSDRRSVDKVIDEKPHPLGDVEGSDGAERKTVTAAPPPGPPPGMAPEDFPDGGLEAWLVVFGGWLAMFCTFGLINCVGVFQTYYVTGPLRDHDNSSVSWILSTQTFFMVFMGGVFGRLFDNYGPVWILRGGTLVYTFGLMMLSLSTSYYQIFLSQSILCSIGASAVFNAAVSSVTTWFFKRRAMAFGVTASGASFGGVIMPIYLEHLFRSSLGFGWTIRIMAFWFLGFQIIACLTVKSRLPPRPRPFNLKEYVTAFSELKMSVTVLGNALFMMGMFVPFNYIILQARATGVSPALIPYLIPIMNAVSIPGRILPGIWADKYGRYNIMIIITFISALFCLAVWVPVHNEVGIVVFLVIFGFSSGGFISLAPSLIAQISPLPQIGTRIGAAFAVQGIGALIGSPIGGAIVSADGGDYLGVQLFVGFVLLGACLAHIGARTVLVGFKWKKV